MGKLFFEPPAQSQVRSNHNDYGPTIVLFRNRCYFPFEQTPSRFLTHSPAASLLYVTSIQKVESMGECHFDH